MLRRVSQTAHRHVSIRLGGRSSHIHSSSSSSSVISSMMSMNDSSNNNNNNNNKDYDNNNNKGGNAKVAGKMMPIRNFGLYRRPHQQFDKDPMMEDEDENVNSELKTSADDIDNDNDDVDQSGMDMYDPLTEGFPFDSDDFPGDDNDDGENEEEEKRQAIRDEIDSRTGRLWTDPWEVTDDDWLGGTTMETLPDWSEDIVSRISKERVIVHPDGIPTLSEITRNSDKLPPSYPPHPANGNTKPYLQMRKKSQYQAVYQAVSELAQSHVDEILDMDSWEQKQNAIDELFESISMDMKEERDDMTVLKSQPFFEDYVERSLQQYLRSIVKDEQITFEKQANMKEETDTKEEEEEAAAQTTEQVDEQKENNTDDDDDDDDDDDGEVIVEQEMEDENQGPAPFFMDLLAVPSSETNETGVPKILHPLKSHAKDGTGRMVEEWDLAAHEGTKRIMIRDCIAKAAKIIVEAASTETNNNNDDNNTSTSSNICQRVYLKGSPGVGKTAALAALVASARTSGHIVLYIPDGDRIRKLGKYTEPNNHYKQEQYGGELLFDLPILAQEICGQMLQSHEHDLNDNMEGVSKSSLEKFMSADKVKKLCAKLEDADEEDDILSLTSLLKLGAESPTYSSTCYSAVIDNLMNQTTKPFTVVMDEFNCYFDHGHYFHEAYDTHANKAIPSHRITLLKPLLNAMGVQKNETGKSFTVTTENPTLMKRGSIIAAGTESRAVAGQFTAALEEALSSSSSSTTGTHDGDCAINVMEVPVFSPLEVEHILANFEVIGIGRLRFDRGETVLDDQEVAFLRMVSGGAGQNLLDACVL